jgi:hypothetical protein
MQCRRMHGSLSKAESKVSLVKLNRSQPRTTLGSRHILYYTGNVKIDYARRT